ncbi:bifunctional 2-keto-4-hydroxyglutarate aldolase/2-keto-3-deoxy-6-phosphogluconate aldolase [Streptococcus jiangjianxini]|uniref:bifunctional 2-keto-4-hydroxyglutarate aldolase/2-keto-3-deoxy-6-phosphogluconate aldolase n=1 Tax=Streptococcus jiangjianxini TaxID=3161189 RepID=UPI0032EC7456
MIKSEILLKLEQQRVVVVIRGNTKEQAIEAAKACIEGGITTIEVAYTNSEASQVIKALNDLYQTNQQIIIGAGTVLDAETARLAILAGAKFIVSPSFNADTASLCNRYTVPYLPGCMTLTEITTALEAGCEIVKIFPGGSLGTSFLKSIKGPLPQVRLMVTGGVSLANAQDWFNSGASIIGIGGEFNQLAEKQQFSDITKIATEFIQLAKT